MSALWLVIVNITSLNLDLLLLQHIRTLEWISVFRSIECNLEIWGEQVKLWVAADYRSIFTLGPATLWSALPDVHGPPSTALFKRKLKNTLIPSQGILT